MSSNIEIPDFVTLIEPGQIDAGVLVGYRTGRRDIPLELSIGAGANLRSGTVIYQGSTIGKGLETGHGVVIREQNLIGDDFAVWNNTVIDYGCRIGNNVKIHANSYVAQYTEIHDDVFMAPGVVIGNDIHPGCPQSGECMRGPIIEQGVQIGVNVTILPMIRIGARALIGSGAVVTRDVPPEMVVYGNPARPVRSIHDLVCTQGFRDKPYESSS
jgi:acetyltransferase-like isoleucine patch superfamily enzyme